jgi:hypothetical protein
MSRATAVPQGSAVWCGGSDAVVVNSRSGSWSKLPRVPYLAESFTLTWTGHALLAVADDGRVFALVPAAR